jgi:hypothetical protein
MLSRDRAERAPEKARKALAFSYGTKQWAKMSAADQEEAYHLFLQDALNDEPKDTGEWFMNVDFPVSDEEGLVLLFHPEDKRLTRLVSQIHTKELGGVIGVVSEAMGRDKNREIAHMAALSEYGFPFGPESDWADCCSRVPQVFEEWVIGKARHVDATTYRTVFGLAGGLYYQLCFEDEKLQQVTITDPELVHQVVTSQPSEEDDDSDSRSSVPRPRNLVEIADFFHDTPGDVESSRLEPGAELIRVESDAEQKSDAEEALSQLSEEDQREINMMMMNTDIELFDELVALMPTFKTAQDFRDARSRLLTNPEKQQEIAAGRAELAKLVSGLDPAKKSALPEAKVRRALRDGLSMVLELPAPRWFSDEELVQDLLPSSDDLHLVRSKVNAALNINFRMQHWEGVRSIADLKGRIHELAMSSDSSQREDVPASALQKLFGIQRRIGERTSACLHEAALSLQSRMKDELASFPTPAWSQPPQGSGSPVAVK